jgi:CDK inhibitor PHO81
MRACTWVGGGGGGAQPELADESDWTPWQHALYAGHMDAADLLEQATRAAATASATAAAAASANASATMVRTGVASTEVVGSPVPAAALAALEAGLGGDDMLDGEVLPLDLDAIPSLSLPPPIIPTRTMGHPFLEGRVRVHLRLGIGHTVPALRLGYAGPIDLTYTVCVRVCVRVRATGVQRLVCLCPLLHC